MVDDTGVGDFVRDIEPDRDDDADEVDWTTRLSTGLRAGALAEGGTGGSSLGTDVVDA